jgi:cardiolipin synthase
MSRSAYVFVILASACLSVQGLSHSASAEAEVDVPLDAPPVPGVLISEFYPCAANDDEYFVLFNRDEAPVELGGWQLTDGEGVVHFLERTRIPALSSFSVSFNGSSYLAAYGSPADIAVDRDAFGVLCGLAGSFRLGNDGDSLVLLDGRGLEVDAVKYGECAEAPVTWIGWPVPSPRTGEVIRRITYAGVPQDTNTAVDWTPFREHRYGYTSWGCPTSDVAPGGLTAFVSPDCIADVLLEVLDHAHRDIRLCTYELSSRLVCRAILRAIDRGVDVRILVDGGPVGGIDDGAVAALSVLTASGAQVRVLAGSMDEGIVRHVYALHSKYMVVDSGRVVVMSENAVPSGVPVDRVFGNRGWGVAIESDELGDFMARVFDDDSRWDRPDVLDWRSDPRYDPFAEPPDYEVSRHPTGMIPPYVTSAQARVTLALSPDASIVEPFMLGLLASNSDIIVEQFQTDLMWRTRWSELEVLNPLIQGVIESTRENASARVLLDSSWFNIERNGEVVDALSLVSHAESLGCSARLLDARSPVTVLHNKGMIADGQRSVVSSNNWVYASFARNRELGAVVESEEVAGYFTKAFDADWYPDVVDPTVDVSKEVSVPVGSWVNLSAEGCSDDRMVADISWDVGSDGTVDSRDDVMPILVAFPGETVVLLTVTDAWGNHATQTITITATGDGYDTVDDDDHVLGRYVSGATVVVVSVFTLLLTLRRRGARGRG